jgi:hypothetical protein
MEETNLSDITAEEEPGRPSGAILSLALGKKNFAECSPIPN